MILESRKLPVVHDSHEYPELAEPRSPPSILVIPLIIGIILMLLSASLFIWNISFEDDSTLYVGTGGLIIGAHYALKESKLYERWKIK